MAKKVKRKFTIVREHPRHVPISAINPDGITIVDRHPRRIPGTYPNKDELDSVFKNYDRTNVIYPAANKLKEFKNADKYDDLIAVWTDFFNKKLNAEAPLDPNVVKALMASESGFQADTPRNPTAFGIAQITKKTLKIIQDPKGETKEFIFTNIRLKDLKNPAIAIPMGVRWLHRKKAIAKSKLGREPTAEEIILEYKGLLKSITPFKDKILDNFCKN